MGVRDHRELNCWILSDQVRTRMFVLAQSSRQPHHRWLTDQLIRASSSACANIAEGFSRFNPKEFARFLTIAKASLSEVIEHLGPAVQLGIVTAEDASDIARLARRARGATTQLILYLRKPKVPSSE